MKTTMILKAAALACAAALIPGSSLIAAADAENAPKSDAVGACETTCAPEQSFSATVNTEAEQGEEVCFTTINFDDDDLPEKSGGTVFQTDADENSKVWEGAIVPGEDESGWEDIELTEEQQAQMDALNEQLRALKAELAEYEDGDDAAYKEAYQAYEKKSQDIFEKMSELVLPDADTLNDSDNCFCYSFSMTENEDGTISQNFQRYPVDVTEQAPDDQIQVWFGAYVPDDADIVWGGAFVPEDSDTYCWEDLDLTDAEQAELDSLNAELDALAAALPDDEGNEEAYKAARKKYDEKVQEIDDRIQELIGQNVDAASAAETDTICGYSYTVNISEDGSAVTGSYKKLCPVLDESETNEPV